MSATQYTAGNSAGNQPTYYPGVIIKQAPSQKNFTEYLFYDNKIFSLLMIGLMICQFVLFKILYPYPDFFSDSYSYIFAAYAHLDVNIWPIGYSKFLLLFHWFTHSATALNFFQYMSLGITSLYFYHTIVYFFTTGSKTRTFLCLFLFFNPLSLYIANYVTSDAIFISLSILWLTQLLWLIHKPKPYQIVVVSIVFFIAFTFRYNAMYYPIIATIAFIMSRQKISNKLAGIFTGLLIIIPFIIFSSNASKKMTGTAQFPPILGGWQWGNNALYMRGFIQEDSLAFPTSETAELDRIARRYFNSPSRPQDQLASYVANFFIRQPEAPLKQYMKEKYGKTGDFGSVQQWGLVAPIFGQYGRFLITRHPLAFARYYLLVNTKNYFLPPLEKLEIYNLGSKKIWPIGAYWFDFPTVKIQAVSLSVQGILLFIFTPLFGLLNLYYGLSVFLFIRRKAWKQSSKQVNISIAIISLLLILNFFFSVFANIIVIRYQIFPMILLAGFTMLLADQLEMAVLGKKQKLSVLSITPEI